MSNINVSVLNGRNGLIIEGVSNSLNLGDAVSGAGDINGDGIVDIIVSAPRSLSDERGQVSIIFGSSDGFAGDSEDFNGILPVSELDGTNGFNINGVSIEQRLGISVSNAGDVNNDGTDDILIGASNTNNDRGDSYVIFGNADIGDGIDLLAVDGTDGFKVDGLTEGDFFGASVTDAGDINDDGIADVAISGNFVDANGVENSGATYVIFGQDGGFPADLDLEDLDGVNGFVINGVTENEFSGNSISSAGDINGDGIDDLIIGARFADPGGRENAGTTYVVFGSSGGFTTELDLANLDGTNGFTINGINAGDGSGFSVTNAGDINGDGLNDLGIGADYADPTANNAGQGYIIFGQADGFDAGFFFLSSLDGSNGFAIDGIEVDDRLGTSVSAAGDVNNDGIDDFAISAVGTNGDAGTTFVVYGQEEDFEGTLNLVEDLNINTGFAIDGVIETNRLGESVSGVGDFNDDGIDDLLVGAPQVNLEGEATEEFNNEGQAYVLFGRIENLGDVDDDGAYTDVDAYLISRMAAGLDSEFEAYPGIDPLLVADVNSDGAVSALDSAIVYSAANGGTSNFQLADFD